MYAEATRLSTCQGDPIFHILKTGNREVVIYLIRSLTPDTLETACGAITLPHIPHYTVRDYLATLNNIGSTVSISIYGTGWDREIQCSIPCYVNVYFDDSFLNKMHIHFSSITASFIRYTHHFLCFSDHRDLLYLL